MPVSRLCILLLLMGCSSDEGSKESQVGTAKVGAASEVVPTPLRPATPPPTEEAPVTAVVADALLPMLKVTGRPRFIESAVVMRESGTSKAPWTSAEVSAGYFYFKPELGAEVSVLPLCERPAFRLQISDIRAEEIEDVPRWETEFSPVLDVAYLEPTGSMLGCNVIVVYPAQDALTAIQTEFLKKRHLPAGITAKHVKVAIDTDGDGEPDALLATYCTEKRQKPECEEATATVLYQRAGKRWRKLYTWEPIT